MSLPPSFVDAADYFEESLSFLRGCQHLYNFPNTKLLSAACLEKINLEGFEQIDLGQQITLQDLAERSGELKEFLTKTGRLTALYDDVEDNGEDIALHAPLSVKKRHEIKYLAREISEACQRAGCDTVVDFGSGLGYLDQLIYSKHNYNVLGLECSNQNYTSAKTRQRKYHLESIDKVKYIRHRIDEGSHKVIGQYLEDKFGSNGGFCIAGLHACADLTIDSLNIFLKMAAARSIVLMSCCYHKMELGSEHAGSFKNFPLSECLRGASSRKSGAEFLKVPFLRLAAQPPRVKEELQDLVFNLLARAVIQLYADKYDLKLTRRKRKAVRTKTIDNDFESYMQQAKDGFQLTCKRDPCTTRNEDIFSTSQHGKCKCGSEFNFDELRKMWREYSQDAIKKKAAIFVLLQRHLQPLLENIVLLDRVTYLEEKGPVNCRMKKIFDDKISPRCFALVAIK